MESLKASATSVGLRTVLSAITGLPARQTIIFNSLDMIISSVASFVFAKSNNHDEDLNDEDSKNLFIVGRMFGYLAAGLITNAVTESMSISSELSMGIISVISQFAPMFLSIPPAMPPEAIYFV